MSLGTFTGGGWLPALRFGLFDNDAPRRMWRQAFSGGRPSFISQSRAERRSERRSSEKRFDEHSHKLGLLLAGVTIFGLNQARGSLEAQCEASCELIPLKNYDGNALEGALIFSGRANRDLAEQIAQRLGTALGLVNLTTFADGEICLQFLESLRGKDVYIIQPTSPPVNEHLMELLLMISTCRRSSAKKITAVVPYYGYARQDRKLSSRVPISAADVARMIESMGVDRVISVDLHCGQIQGFFGPRVPVDNLEAQRTALDYFVKKNLHKPVIVSPDAGGVYRARKFQEALSNAVPQAETGLAMLIKQRSAANQIDSMELVGSVEGADVVIVDDMIDTAGTLCEAAKMLRTNGAKRVFCFATHGLFSGPAIDRIEKSCLEEVVVSDSIRASEMVQKCPRITQLSIAPLLADAIYHVHKKESIHNVFYKEVQRNRD